jgi:putative SOS response-associated peptidase YedK
LAISAALPQNKASRLIAPPGGHFSRSRVACREGRTTLCERYACFRDVDQLNGLFGANAGPLGLHPNWNVSPGQEAPVVGHHRATGTRRLGSLEWGGKLEYTIPAESVKADEKLARLAQGRRCLVPVDAFYLWFKQASGIQPIAIARRDRKTMAVAGLWDTGTGANGEVQQGFAILTTEAAGVVKAVQDSMPVVLNEVDWPLWLGEVAGDFRALLRAPNANHLTGWQVSKRVYGRANQGSQLLAEEFALNPGDSLVSFRLAVREVGTTYARLVALRGWYEDAMTDRSPAPTDLAFRTIADTLAGCLIEAERLCARISLAKAPANHVWPFQAADKLAYRQEIIDLGRSLTETSLAVAKWASPAEKWLAWHAPTLPQATKTVQLRLREDRLRGDADYIRAANAITSIVNLMVDYLQAKASELPARESYIRGVEIEKAVEGHVSLP